LAGDRFVPAMATDMIANAEVTGTLPEVLTQISDYYEKETDLSIRNVFAVMEPLFVIIIGVVVGMIAVSMLLPIFKLDGAMG
jgi:type IV pilus assembly protein PilC